jgi:hypothetical protein
MGQFTLLIFDVTRDKGDLESEVAAHGLQDAIDPRIVDQLIGQGTCGYIVKGGHLNCSVYHQRRYGGKALKPS